MLRGAASPRRNQHVDVGTSSPLTAKLVVQTVRARFSPTTTFFYLWRRKIIANISCSSRRYERSYWHWVEGGRHINFRPQHSALLNDVASASRSPH